MPNTRITKLPTPAGVSLAQQKRTEAINRLIEELKGVSEFTPTSWTGFSSDPSGALNYSVTNSVVLLWSETVLTGTSDSTSFELDGVPEEIRPVNSAVVESNFFDSNNRVPGAAIVNTDGTIVFLCNTVVSAQVQYSTSGWTASGSKGFDRGTMLIYQLS